MTNREHAEREITRRNGRIVAANEEGTVVRVQFAEHMIALNAYDAVFADVAQVDTVASDPRVLVIHF